MNSRLSAGCLVKIWRKDFFPLSRHFFSRVPVNVTDISLGQDFKRNLHLVTNSVSCTPSVNKAQLKRRLIASKEHRKRCFHICAVAYNTYIWSVLCIHWMSIKGLKRGGENDHNFGRLPNGGIPISKLFWIFFNGLRFGIKVKFWGQFYHHKHPNSPFDEQIVIVLLVNLFAIS